MQILEKYSLGYAEAELDYVIGYILKTNRSVHHEDCKSTFTLVMESVFIIRDKIGLKRDYKRHLGVSSMPLNKWRFMCLPGVQHNFLVSKQRDIAQCKNLTLMWMNNMYTKYKGQLQLIQTCGKENKLVSCGAEQCDVKCWRLLSLQNMKRKRRRKYHFMLKKEILRQMTVFVAEQFVIKFPLFTWASSDRLCSQAGGQLPSFSSRHEMNEFVAFFKLFHEINPIEVLFIAIEAIQVHIKLVVVPVLCIFLLCCCLGR